MREKKEVTQITKLAMLRKDEIIKRLANESSPIFDANRGKFNSFLNNHQKTLNDIRIELNALAEKHFEIEEVNGQKRAKTIEMTVDGKTKKIAVCKQGMTEAGYEKELARIESEMVTFILM